MNICNTYVYNRNFNIGCKQIIMCTFYMVRYESTILGILIMRMQLRLYITNYSNKWFIAVLLDLLRLIFIVHKTVSQKFVQFPIKRNYSLAHTNLNIIVPSHIYMICLWVREDESKHVQLQKTKRTVPWGITRTYRIIWLQARWFESLEALVCKVLFSLVRNFNSSHSVSIIYT